MKVGGGGGDFLMIFEKVSAQQSCPEPAAFHASLAVTSSPAISELTSTPVVYELTSSPVVYELTSSPVVSELPSSPVVNKLISTSSVST